jgi:hypothetical protein
MYYAREWYGDLRGNVHHERQARLRHIDENCRRKIAELTGVAGRNEHLRHHRGHRSGIAATLLVVCPVRKSNPSIWKSFDTWGRLTQAMKFNAP